MEFSIGQGPYWRVLRPLHVARTDRAPSALRLVAIAWLPLMVVGLFEFAVNRRPPAILGDLSVHTRLLVAIPMFVLASRLLDERCHNAVRQLYDNRLAAAADLDPIVERASRLRGSKVVELALAITVVTVGQIEVWAFGRSGFYSGVTDAGGLSFALVWYASIALPIVQFLLLDWVWQWLIWSYVVVRVSRVHVELVGTNPDRVGGIGFIESPLSAFAVAVFASAAMMAGAWGTQMIRQHVHPDTFLPEFLAFVVVVGVIACAPLLMFGPKLYRARHRESRKYGALAVEYGREFQSKWIDGHPADERILGSPDMQSLNDMIGAVSHVKKMRLVPIGARSLVSIWAAAVLPMIPLAASTIPLKDLVHKLGEALLAGLPL